MHIPFEKTPAKKAAAKRASGGAGAYADEEELIKIFEMTYGKIRRRTPSPLETPKDAPKSEPKAKKIKDIPNMTEYLLIDAYNIIFACDSLKAAAKDSLEHARKLLLSRLISYYAVKKCEIIVVFDAYKVKGGQGSVEKVGGITVVYTKEAETADSYIERTSHVLSKNNRVRVATSDNLEQMIILGSGAYRMSASEFLRELEEAEEEIDKFVEMNNLKNRDLDNKVLTQTIIEHYIN